MLFKVVDLEYPEDGYVLIDAENAARACAEAAKTGNHPHAFEYKAFEASYAELAIAELQKYLPWGLNDYSEAYGDDRAPHRDYRHAAMHLAKAAGILLVTPEEMDHDPSLTTAEARRIEDTKRLADVVIVALRMAITHPSGPIVLAEAIDERLRGKKADEEQRKLSGR